MYRSFRYFLPMVAIAAVAAGCGGGGGLSTDDRSYTGSLDFRFGGAPTGLDVTTANVTVTKLELRNSDTGEYQSVWTGSKGVDLLAAEQETFSCSVPLGAEVNLDFDALRVSISHVVLVDTELGSFDEDVAWTLEFPLDMRVLAGRKALLRAVLPLAAFEVQEADLALNETIVHEANGTDTGVLAPQWMDSVYLDLSHLAFEIPLPSGEPATGIWFSNDNIGMFVDDPDGTGGEFYSMRESGFELGGTYRYDDPQKNTVTWYVEDEAGLETGTSYALRTVCPLKANGWSALVMGGGTTEHGLFLLVKTDADRNIVDVYGGDIQLNDEEDPTKGGTAEVISLYDEVYDNDEAIPMPVTLTYDGKASGTFTFSAEHGALPATGTWVLYLPGG